MSLDFPTLFNDLDNCTYIDQIRLRKRIFKVTNIAEIEQKTEAYNRVAKEVCDALARADHKRSRVVHIEYPKNLPVSLQAADIAESIKSNQVVIVAGETGSGKTTQLPKICIQAGFGRKGLIGHTQPRRLAARTVSNRIAEEMHVQLGSEVGYQVRFSDNSSDNTLVKVMTDGILLSEIKNDRYLNKYEVIIIDEAHERSLNIDFLLGFLKQLLSKRKELKLVITSATIDVDRFSNYFSNAPVFSVEGRTFPVEVNYRPPNTGDEYSLTLSEQIIEVIEEIEQTERTEKRRAGDVLVFLPGEREIREVARQLNDQKLRDTEVLPLYARLSNKDQNRVFASHPGRRIVLSTNVAETSITVPGIGYVIDPGLVRISRYSYRSKIQRLPIEAISQASANQRMGRCGRVADGICYRLYSEEDFLSRSEFTDPEILRTNLAAVILKMIGSGVGAVDRFEFIDSPDSRLWNDGYKLLQELQAVDQDRRITKLGRQLATLPTDPKLAKMLLTSADKKCLKEVLVIVSALSIQDPRDRPPEKQQAADQAHSQFKDTDSDFTGLLNLWNVFEEQRQLLSSNQLKKYCQKNFLSFMRMREWREIHTQLHILLKSLKIRENNEPASYDAIHQSILSGLLGYIGKHDEKRDYLGCRNRKFTLFPGSAVNKKKPKWLVSAEIVETQQVYARSNARIDPAWLEETAAHLVKKSWSEPQWHSKRAQVLAKEKVTLYGLEIVANRLVNYSQIDPEACRKIFIRSGIVELEFRTNNKAIRANEALIKGIEQIEDRTRRRDVLVDDEVVFELYNKLIPPFVVNGASFDKWYKKLTDEEKSRLCFSRDDLVLDSAPAFDSSLFPEHMDNNGIQFPLKYQFNPGKQQDGVTVSIPVNAIGQVTNERLERLVPGLLREKCIQLIKNLPRTLRKHFVPVPDVVDEILPKIESSATSLLQSLTHELKRKTLVEVPFEAWDVEKLDDHLRFNIEVLNDQGKVVEQGRNLVKIADKVKHFAVNAVEAKKAITKIVEYKTWSFGTLKTTEESLQAGIKLTLFPAIQDQVDYIETTTCNDPEHAKKLTRIGVARLLSFRLKNQSSLFKKELPYYSKIALLYAPIGQAKTLHDDFFIASITNHFLATSDLPRTKEEFDALYETKRASYFESAVKFSELVYRIMNTHHQLMKKLKGKVSLTVAIPMADLQAQLSELVVDKFLQQTSMSRLEQFPRYLEACQCRFDKMARDIANERRYVPILKDWWEKFQQRKKQLELQGIWDQDLIDFRWLIEEQRVSWYAQHLGTSETVSEKRLNKHWESLLVGKA